MHRSVRKHRFARSPLAPHPQGNTSLRQRRKGTWRGRGQPPARRATHLGRLRVALGRVPSEGPGKDLRPPRPRRRTRRRSVHSGPNPTKPLVYIGSRRYVVDVGEMKADIQFTATPRSCDRQASVVVTWADFHKPIRTRHIPMGVVLQILAREFLD
jgi:hypothetical protein